MLKTLVHPDGIHEIVLGGYLDAQLWTAYEDLVMTHLENNYERLYILCNCSEVEDIDENIYGAFSQGAFLGHPLLGHMIILTLSWLHTRWGENIPAHSAYENFHDCIPVYDNRRYALEALRRQRETDDVGTLE